MPTPPTPTAPRPECTFCDFPATTTINNGKTDVCHACKETEESAKDEARILSAVTKVLNAWFDAGPNPAYHQAMKEKLRREWPTLYDALVHLSKP